LVNLLDLTYKGLKMNKKDIIKYKICSKCKTTKLLIEFCKDKNRKDNLSTWCKSCCKLSKKLHTQNTRKERSIKAKKYYQKNRKEILKKCKQYRKLHKEKSKKYKKEHQEELKQYCKNYNRLNKKRFATDRKQRRYMDIKFKIGCNLRTRIWHAVKNNSKSKPTMKLIGCAIEQLKQHLEIQFTENMTWNNYGKWHIDHIKPCCSFDLSKPREQHKCFNYKNLQPLWAKDNRVKSGKYNIKTIRFDK